MTDELPNGSVELAIKMGQVVEEMNKKVAQGLPGFNILLSALMAITALERSPAVEADFLCTFLKMGQKLFSIKIRKDH